LLSFFAPFLVSYSVAMVCFHLYIHAEHPFQLPTYTGCCLFFCRPSWNLSILPLGWYIHSTLLSTSRFHRSFPLSRRMYKTFSSVRDEDYTMIFYPNVLYPILPKNKHDSFTFGLLNYYTVVFSKTLHYNFVRLSKLILKRKVRSFGGSALKGSPSGPSSHISRSMNKTCPSLRTNKTVERRVP